MQCSIQGCNITYVEREVTDEIIVLGTFKTDNSLLLRLMAILLHNKIDFEKHFKRKINEKNVT